MKRALIWLSVLLVVVVGGRYGVQYMQESAVTHEARVRVEAVLDSLMPGGDRSHAIDMWYRGSKGSTMKLSVEQGTAVTLTMFRWLAAKGLKDTVSSYTIDDVVFVKEREGYKSSIARVACTIDGRSVEMLVARDEEIAWAD